MNKTIILRIPSSVIVSGVRKLGPVSQKYQMYFRQRRPLLTCETLVYHCELSLLIHGAVLRCSSLWYLQSHTDSRMPELSNTECPALKRTVGILCQLGWREICNKLQFFLDMKTKFLFDVKIEFHRAVINT